MNAFPCPRNPMPCCDYGKANPLDLGDDDGDHVLVCNHLVDPDCLFTYDPQEVLSTGATLIRIYERRDALTEHLCADPDCRQWVLCATHWTELP